MKKHKEKRNKQLGLNEGTAASRLKKRILFHYVKLANQHYCFQCKKEIIDVKDFTVEHKVPWLDAENAAELFNDINNIAFSHLKCNIVNARKKYCEHGTARKYALGCRCELCTKANTEKVTLYRKRKNNASVA